MVQAAVTGAVDFSTAALLDRHWWLKLRWILDRFEDVQAIDVFKLQHAQHMAVVEYGLEKQTFETHWKGGNDLIQRIYAVNFPWAAKTTQPGGKDYDDLLTKWKEKFGDIKDPKVREKFNRIARAMHQHNKRRRIQAAERPSNPQRAKLQKLISSRRNKLTRKR